MKKLIGGLAFAGVVAASCGSYWFAKEHDSSKFAFAESEESEGRTPSEGDSAAIRLGYHGSATDFTVNPAWYVEAAKQDARIAAAVPTGAKTYAPTADSPLALDPNAFTLLGPQPLTGEGFGANRAAGRVNAIVSDPDNPAVAWIGSDGGGVWKTTTCCTPNTTWTVKTDFPQIASMAIDDITMDPSDHNVLYAATGDLNYGSFSFGSAGVLKSSDKGETWSLLGENVFNMMYGPSANGAAQYQSISKVVVDPNNSSNVIAGTKTGLYFSYDAGVNWAGPCYTNNFASGPSAQRQDMTGLLAVKNGSATRLYAAVGTRGKATPVQPDLGKNGANGVYSAAMPTSGCPASGAWTLLNSGMPAGLGNGSPSANLGRIEIAAAPSNNQVLYAMISDVSSSGINGIYKTSNGGTSWTATSLPASGDVGTQMWYDAGLSVSPTDPTVLFISTVDLLVSKDSGGTYTNLTHAYSGGPVHPDNHARAFVGGNQDQIINGNDGGVYYASNAVSGSASPTWTDMNNQLPTIEVYGGNTTANFATAANPGVAAGFQDNGSATAAFSGTPTGAVAWDSNNGGDGFYSLIEPVLGNNWYSSIYYGNLYKSSSRTGAQAGIGGAWGPGSATSVDRKNFVTQFDMYRYGSTSVAGSGCTAAAGCTHLIYGTYRLWESTSAGGSWTAKTGDLTKNNLIIGTDNRSYMQMTHYSFSDPTVAMVGTTDGNVQYVFGLGGSGAATAVNVTGNNAVLPNRMILDVNTDPANPLVGYAAVAGFTANTPATPGHVFQVTCTANCASFTWVDKSGNLPDIPADTVIANPLNTKQVFVGMDWGLYYTNDITVATPVWQRFEGLPHVMVWSLSIDRGFTTLSAYTRGRGVWAWPLPTGSVGGPFSLAATPAAVSVCAGTPASYTLNLSANNYSGTVSFGASGNPAPSTVAFSPASISTFPGSSTMSVTTTGVAAGSYPITITGTGTGSPAPDPQTTSVSLNVSVGNPTGAGLTAPANAATGVGTAPTFTWAASAGASSYTLEVASDAAFNTIVQSLPNLTSTNASVSGLAPTTTYYWRVKAFNSCGNTTSAAFSFTTANVLAPICSTSSVAIPDNTPAGVNSTITITDASQLVGLQVQIKATHTYVGDLKFTLSKGAANSVLINQPGAGGCASDNIDVTLDDAGATPVQSQCNGTPPALSGVDSPANPINAVFAGQSFAGTYTLNAADLGAVDTGTLTQWCLVPTVAATTTTYTIGGNVSGLSGPGLVLSLNSGAQSLPVSASGSFTFPTGLASGAAYAVTVGTQPGGLTCTVANGSGTIGSANVTNVAVTCIDTIFKDGFEGP